jgi:hypothetical protein
VTPDRPRTRPRRAATSPATATRAAASHVGASRAAAPRRGGGPASGAPARGAKGVGARVGGARAGGARGVRALAAGTLALGLAAVGLGACGGARYDGAVYADGDVRYRAEAPGAGWSRVRVAGHNDLAWSSDALGAVVQVNATCGRPDDDVPLRWLTEHLLNGFTAREVHAQETFTLDGREALRTHVTARLDGVPRELLFVVLKKNGCVYDLALVAPPGERFARARPDYERLVASFRTLDGPGAGAEERAR